MIFTLFLTFAKIGLFTFGGGYAMISMIESICVEQKKWITHDDMMKVTVIAESTPGPVAINCATFVGYKQKGLAGAIAATIGVVLPSFTIIYLIAVFLDDFLEITWIASAFKGIRIGVGILILGVGIKMIGKLKTAFRRLFFYSSRQLLRRRRTYLTVFVSSIALLTVALSKAISETKIIVLETPSPASSTGMMSGRPSA